LGGFTSLSCPLFYLFTAFLILPLSPTPLAQCVFYASSTLAAHHVFSSSLAKSRGGYLYDRDRKDREKEKKERKTGTKMGTGEAQEEAGEEGIGMWTRIGSAVVPVGVVVMDKSKVTVIYSW
jgi:hypothetical protein